MRRHPLIAYALPCRRRLGNGLLLGAPGRERFLEALVVAGLVLALVTLQLASYAGIRQKFSLYEAVNLIGGFRYEIGAELATTGRLPETVVNSDTEKPRVGRYMERVAWRDGEIVFEFGAGFAAASAGSGDGPFELSLRPAQDATGARLVFVCGEASLPAGFSAPPPVHHSAPAAVLPAICRS